MTVLGGISILISLYVCAFIAFLRKHYEWFSAFLLIGMIMTVFVVSRIILP